MKTAAATHMHTLKKAPSSGRTDTTKMFLRYVDTFQACYISKQPEQSSKYRTCNKMNAEEGILAKVTDPTS